MAEIPGRLASRTILVVDDQAEVRELLRSALVEAGARVQTAADGAEALALLSSLTPDVLLLDLYMPAKTGWQLVEELIERGRPLPAIVLQTSADDYATLQRARTLGVAAYVSKPFRLAEVVETCARVAEGARPLLGRGGIVERPRRLLASGHDGVPLASGMLLEIDEHGAQLDLDTALPVGRRFRFVLDPDREGPREIQGEIRWVRAVGGRWLHGVRR